jgi:hypothetical protein
MALTEKVIIDLIEVLETNVLQVRHATIIERDGVEISRTFHRTTAVPGDNLDNLAEKVKTILTSGIELSMITNRGIKVWPDGFSETFCTDHWRCRFKPVEGSEISNAKIIELLNNALNVNLDTIKTENLYSFNGKSAYSLGQGQ